MTLLSVRFLKLLSGVIVLTFLCQVAKAQFARNYSPRQTHSQLSKDLIEGLESQFDEEDKTMPGSKEVRQINFERRRTFMEKVMNGAFIKDDSLEKYVDNVLDRIVDSSTLQPYPRKALILSSPHVNAVCYGQGIYAVTVSLLGRIENEDQLAFILAHELAHDELGHIKTRVVKEADLDLEGKAREQTFRIISGKVVKEEIEQFRETLYDYTRHSRRNEIMADSMAIVLLRKAGYNEGMAFAALSVLQAAQSPKHEIGAELFLPFHSPDYPFQDYWLNDRPIVYSKKYMGTFLYAADSIETHPGIDIRKKLLGPYIKHDATTTIHQPQAFVETVGEISAFESVESAYKTNEYDLSLYYALQLHNRYPNNAYLVSRIGKILTDLYDARNSNGFYNYVPKYTPNHGDELKLINSFLHNLSQEELGELAYRFLHHAGNFNQQEKSHYYLLWKIASLTGKNDVLVQVAAEYGRRFGSGINFYKYR